MATSDDRPRGQSRLASAGYWGLFWVGIALGAAWYLLAVKNVAMTSPWSDVHNWGPTLRLLLVAAVYAGLAAAALRLGYPWCLLPLAALAGGLLVAFPLAQWEGHVQGMKFREDHYESLGLLLGIVPLGLVAGLGGAALVAWRQGRPAGPWVSALVVLLLLAGTTGYPLMLRARPKACSNSCLSNVKQLMLGALMYASDNDNHLPPALDWPQRILPYVKNMQIFICPTDQPPFLKSGDLDVSYAVNRAANQLALSSLAEPASLVVLFDGQALYGGVEAADFRHNQGVNAGFADGHAKWLAARDFTADRLVPGKTPVTPVKPGEKLPPPAVSPWKARAYEAARKALKPEQVRALERMAAVPPERAPQTMWADVKLTGPREVWTGDAALVVAHAVYELPPELAREALAGRVRISENYREEGGIGEAFGREERSVPGRWVYEVAPSTPPRYSEVKVTYTVSVSGVEDYSRQERRIEATASLQVPVRDFAVGLEEPTRGERYVTCVGRRVQFRGSYRVQGEALRWTWLFGDGSFARGEATEHVYARPGRYWAVGRASLGEHALEVWLPVTVLPGWPPALPRSPERGPGPGLWYQVKAPGNLETRPR